MGVGIPSGFGLGVVVVLEAESLFFGSGSAKAGVFGRTRPEAVGFPHHTT